MAVRRLPSNLVPRACAGPVAVRSDPEAPRYWATVYSAQHWSGLSAKTIHEKLAAVDSFYRFASVFFGSDKLDQLIASLGMKELAIVIEAFFVAERNRAVQSGSDANQRWRTVRAFLFDTLGDIAASQHEKHEAVDLKAQVTRWELKYRNLSPNPAVKRVSVLRALPAQAIEEVYELFDPTSAKNPFRSEWLRRRNMCLLLCLLHQGLRRGEALLLPVDAVKMGTDDRTLRPRFWMNVTNLFADEDPRFCDPPSLKNAQSVRQIPVSREVAKHIDVYVNHFRGKSPYPHLFLNSRRGPLGSRGVTDIFVRASRFLSEKARKTLTDNMRKPTISAHDLRHTCAVTRLAHFRAAGIGEEEAISKLRSFFGWSFKSEMPRLYARAYWEHHVETVWNDDFDAHIAALRSIAPSNLE